MSASGSTATKLPDLDERLLVGDELLNRLFERILAAEVTNLVVHLFIEARNFDVHLVYFVDLDLGSRCLCS